MIYEDYNRGPEKRFIENIKVWLGFKTSVGIMQVTSGKKLSNEQSVQEAYKMICDFKRNLQDNMYEYNFARDVAIQYNPDERYADSVAYIHNTLVNSISNGAIKCKEIRRKIWKKHTAFQKKRRYAEGVFKCIMQ